jgi:small-conductance mechanosensitive channel
METKLNSESGGAGEKVWFIQVRGVPGIGKFDYAWHTDSFERIRVIAADPTEKRIAELENRNAFDLSNFHTLERLTNKVMAERDQLAQRVKELVEQGLQEKAKLRDDNDQLAQRVKDEATETERWKRSAEAAGKRLHELAETFREQKAKRQTDLREIDRLSARLADAEARELPMREAIENSIADHWIRNGCNGECDITNPDKSCACNICRMGRKALATPPGNALDKVREKLMEIITAKITDDQLDITWAYQFQDAAREAAESIGHNLEETK